MTTTPAIEVTAGDLIAANRTDRRVTFRLLPYGVPGATNRGRVIASRGSVDLAPTIELNDRHIGDRRLGVAITATDVEDRDDALVATFTIDPGPAGDEYLDEVDRIRAGTDPHAELRRSASVEVANPVIRAGRLVGGLLARAGAVVRPAFPGADLLVAADAGDLDDDELVVNGVRYRRVTEPDPEPEPEPATDPAPPTASPTPEETPTMTATDTTPTPATAPAGLPGRPAGDEGSRVTVRELSALIAAAHDQPGRELHSLIARHAEGADDPMFAALADIKHDTGAGANINQPAWLGELWGGKRYNRRFLPLFGAVQPLTSIKGKGWKWETAPTGGDWAGDKANVPSAAVTTEPQEFTAHKFAGGHDHAREYRDFPNPDYWESYFRAMTDAYAKWSDDHVLNDAVTAAPDVTAGTVPTDVPAALAYIVDGMLATLDYGTPSFAVVTSDLWRSLVLTPTDKALEFLNASVGLEDGTLAGFRIVPAAPTAALPAGSVLVGSTGAATPRELPGAPIRVEGLDLVKGGIDTAVFGYVRLDINEANGLAHVAPSAG